MKTIKKVKYKSGDLILRKNAGLILPVTNRFILLKSKGPLPKRKQAFGLVEVVITKYSALPLCLSENRPAAPQSPFKPKIVETP